MNIAHSTASIISYVGRSFASHFMTLQNVKELIREHPEKIDVHLIGLIEKILKYKKHDKQKLASILYREAAHLLKEISVITTDITLKDLSLSILKDFSKNILNTSSYPASFALGTLPIKIDGPEIIENNIPDNVYKISQDDIFKKVGFKQGKKIILGRSTLFLFNDSNKVLVFKFAKNKNDVKNLLKEIKWILYLKQNAWDKLFSVPDVIHVKGNFVFSFNNNSSPFICFLVPKQYFVYPNGLGLKSKVSYQEFLAILEKNAKILGMLMDKGIIHTAVIPLFHNRTQRNRRSDSGVYLWDRGGRLDRWLESSLYPNIGASGIRDFEHIESFSGDNRTLFFRQMGNQILSFILIIGSYFRMQDPSRVGITKDGSITDARDLFSKPLFKKAVDIVIKNYFEGFNGYKINTIPFQQMDYLVERLIEEMGMDKYMEEIIRVEDQKAMNRKEFEKVLLQYGYTKNQIKEIKKGEKDITIYSGPHLGEFNGRISVPELIEFVAATTALVISSKYLNQIAFNSSF